MRISSFVLVFLFFHPAAAQEYRDVPLQLLGGRATTVESYVSAGPTLIAFWATWCSPCKQELRALQGVYETYRDRGFTVVAVNRDSPRSLAKVRAYIASQKFTFPVALDPNGQTLQRFNAQEIPYSVLLGSDGGILYSAMGYIPGDEKKLERILKDHLPDGR